MTLELMHRHDGATDVSMVYHGVNANPKVEVVLIDETEGRIYYLTPGEDRIMDAFLHPFAFIDEVTA